MPRPGSKDFQQSYNCRAVVDSIHQVIVAARALNLSPDKRQAAAMVEDAIGDVGAFPRRSPPTPVFGQIKQGLGFRQLLLWGRKKVNREWLLICAGHNLLDLFRFGTCLPGRKSGKVPARAAGEPAVCQHRNLALRWSSR